MNTYGPLFDKPTGKGIELVDTGGGGLEIWEDGKAVGGEELRDEGIKQVSEHNENWMYHAFRSALCFVMTSKSDFTGEDIRFHCLGHAGDPSTPHAWGALINTLVRRKIIIPTGEHRKMKDSRSHARSTPVYKAG